MPRVRHLLLLVLAVFALSACNTIRGIGQDVKKAGEKVEDAAD
ncbi:MAG: entericidin A/B family lipoprotein [Arenimonas sp.]